MQTSRKLYGNTYYEFAGISRVSTASCEEEACRKSFFFKVFTSDSASNCRFSGTG
jgi:hypothetical protein